MPVCALLLLRRVKAVAAEPLKRIPQFMPHKSLPAVKVDRNAQVTYTQVRCCGSATGFLRHDERVTHAHVERPHFD